MNHETYVRRLLEETREEVIRADSKASLLLAGAGIVVGILASGPISGDVSFGERGAFIELLVYMAGLALLTGVVLVGCAVYPRLGSAEPGRARWFGEVHQYDGDQQALAAAVQFETQNRGRDLQQVAALAAIVSLKYKLTQAGMWSLGAGFVVTCLAALLVAWTSEG